MTRSRFLLPGLGILLLTIVATGFYLYRHLPELLREQAVSFLQKYGVEDIAYTGVTILDGEVHVATLLLAGVYESLVYEVRLESAALHYDWRTLLSGRVKTLTLSNIELSISMSNADENKPATPIRIDRLLPQALIAQLPIESLSIKRWHLDYQPTDGTALSASGRLKIDGHVDLRLSTTLAGRDVTAEVFADADAAGLDAVISVQDNTAAIAEAAVKLRPVEGERWQWHLQGNADHAPALAWLQQLDAQGEPDSGIRAADTLVMQGDSVFDVKVNHGNELTLGNTENANDHLLQQISATLQLRNNIQRLDIPSLVSALSGTLAINAAYDKGQLTASAQPFSLAGDLWTARLSLPQNVQRWLGWGKTVPASLETTEQLNIAHTDEGLWSVQLQNAFLSLGEKDTRIRLQKLSLDAKVQGDELIDASTQLSASISTRLRKQIFPQLEMTLTQRGSINASAFTLRVADTAESFVADLGGTLNLATGAGNSKLDARIKDLGDFSASTVPLLRAFDLLKNEVKIRSGTVQLTSAIKSNDFDMLGWEQQSDASIKNMSGSVDEYRFDGLSLTAQWSGITRWKTQRPLEISLEKFHPGFAVENIHLRISLPKATPIARPQIRIDAFSAGMFSGEVFQSDTQLWDFAAPGNQITLRAKGWQLADLVALQTNADIQAQGVLEGELPVTIADGRVMIDKGYLRAMPPGGTIRYRANEESRALAKSSPELALAIDLLSDFQFQVLSSQVELDKEGNLLLGLSLAGSNPSQYDGQAINFNINLEQNLDPLLQSLRLSDNVAKRIEGKMK